MSSVVPRSARLSRPVKFDGTQRTVKVTKQHQGYHKRYMRELRGMINGTDYLVGLADDSMAQGYFAQTGTHKVKRVHELDQPRDEEFKFRNPVSPRIPSYLTKKRKKRDEERFNIENSNFSDLEEDNDDMWQHGSPEEGLNHSGVGVGTLDEEQTIQNENENGMTNERAALEDANAIAGHQQEFESGEEIAVQQIEEEEDSNAKELSESNEGVNDDHGAEDEDEKGEDKKNEDEQEEIKAESENEDEGEHGKDVEPESENKEAETKVENEQENEDEGQHDKEVEPESENKEEETNVENERENEGEHDKEAEDENENDVQEVIDQTCTELSEQKTFDAKPSDDGAEEVRTETNTGEALEGSLDEKVECSTNPADVAEQESASRDTSEDLTVVGQGIKVTPEEVAHLPEVEDGVEVDTDDDKASKGKLRSVSMESGLHIKRFAFVNARASFMTPRTKWEILDNSEDDGNDTRPSNCGLGPNGSSEIVLEISASELSSLNLESVEVVEYERIRADGFSWIFITGIPPGTNLDVVSRTVKSAGLRLMTDYISPESARYADGVRCGQDELFLRRQLPKLVLIGRTEGDGFDYIYDSKPYELLCAGDTTNFAEYIQWQEPEQLRHFLHYSEQDGLYFNERSAFTATAAMLMLPGMKVIRKRDLSLCEPILRLLQKKSVTRGVMSVVEASNKTGNMAVWKYTRGRQHILICVNFSNFHCFADILCEDAPDPDDEDGRIPVLELITDTTFMRDVQELRTKGLTVILYEYQIQIFEY